MDVVSAILDTELGCTGFTVERITHTRARSGTGSRSTTFQASGCIHPGTPEMLKLLPEEERNETFIAVYTDFMLSAGTPEDTGASFTAADRIHWNGQTWRVVRVRDWRMFRYCQAYAVLMQEEASA